MNRFITLARDSCAAWVDDEASTRGAAIAYYTVFSIAPLLLIVIAVAGLVWGRDAVQGQIIASLAGLVGRDGAAGIQAILASASKPTEGLVATGISLVALVVGATTVFGELQSALDHIWRVPEAAKKSGVWHLLRTRVLSFGLVLGLGFLMIASLIVSAGLSALSHWANGLLPEWEIWLQVLNAVVSIGTATVLFAMIFKLMPTARVAWRDVWVGAAVTAVLFEIGKVLIGLYIGKTGVTSSLAAAGSIVVLLLWVYYAAQIFLLGAEFTWVYARNRAAAGDGMVAAPVSVWPAARTTPGSSAARRPRTRP